MHLTSERKKKNCDVAQVYEAIAVEIQHLTLGANAFQRTVDTRRKNRIVFQIEVAEGGSIACTRWRDTGLTRIRDSVQIDVVRRSPSDIANVRFAVLIAVITGWIAVAGFLVVYVHARAGAACGRLCYGHGLISLSWHGSPGQPNG